MIRIYTAPSCASCRKVKAWLKEHDIPYVEKNIFSTILREDELRELGTLTVAEPLILKNVDYNVIFLSNFLF